MSGMEERAVAFLEECVKQDRILIDTCSLLSEGANAFWRRIVPVLEREGKAVVVPLRVCEEVQKFAENPALCEEKGDPALNRRAQAVLRDLGKLQQAGVIELFGDRDDNFADNVFQTVFTKYRMKYDLLLITQDQILARDILEIGNSQAVSTRHRIRVRRLNKAGILGRFSFDAAQPAGEERRRPARSGRPAQKPAPVPEEECFAFAASVRQVSGTMAVTALPQAGDTLTAERGGSRKEVTLLEAGGSGGEGQIYTTSIPGLVAKIYKPNRLDRAKFEKLRLMMTREIDCEGVCFPLALLYNGQNEFVGYLMKQAQGKELQRCVFIPQLLKKNFPSWTRIDTVTLCITILKKLCYLHERNIILGDINPNNILVVSPAEVYFVDTDSYQIEGFPCPVGTINYTAPEIQRREYSSFLRTMGNEYFAVATLLFMIMLPGKPPYSLQGGENQIDNIINGDFAYASGERSTGKAPEGVWRFCWSHLPRYLKDDFYETFRKGGEHSTEETRYSTEDWLRKFERYLELLTSGKLSGQDAMSLDIFPTRLKKNLNAVYTRCRLCGNEVEEDRTEQGICQDCLKQGEIYYCTQCGRKMLYTNYRKYIRQLPKHEICKDCLDRKRMVYTTVRCADCGQSFDITYGAKDYCERNGFPFPKRCRDCRENRADHASHSNADAAGSGRWCFLTTAACEYFGRADDCYELTQLRRFRDGWLAAQPGGEALIREYYRIAPPIVAWLNASEHRDERYRDIWERCILPCVRLIEENEYEACRKRYEAMVLELKGLMGKEQGDES